MALARLGLVLNQATPLPVVQFPLLGVTDLHAATAATSIAVLYLVPLVFR